MAEVQHCEKKKNGLEEKQSKTALRNNKIGLEEK